MAKLIATARILYKSVQYYPGDELPQDSDYTEAWLSAGSAVLKDDSSSLKAPKAQPISAQAGAEGINVINGESDETLIGKVPLTDARKTSGTKRTAKKRVANE